MLGYVLAVRLLFGLTNPLSNRRRSKEQDYLAETGGFTVLIPDWFRGNNNPGPFPTPEWLTQVTQWSKIESDWNNVVLPFLEARQSGTLSIGLIGFTDYRLLFIDFVCYRHLLGKLSCGSPQ